MKFKLSQLPYARDALEPHMSSRTLDFHYGKHHQGYVNKVNAAIENAKNAPETLEDLARAARQSGDTGLFNNTAQVINHDFLWQSMSPNGGGKPDGSIGEAIAQAFGNYDDFRKTFTSAASSQFGSGWTWLVVADGVLEITSTSNAENPLFEGQRPLLTLDVWEHAYYLDYQNERGRYIDVFLDKLVNWEFANANLAAG